MLYRNDMTGLPNSLAFEDGSVTPQRPISAFIDTDWLKFTTTPTAKPLAMR